jgi:hypothetical protein
MPSVTDAPAAFLAFGGEAATVSRTGYVTPSRGPGDRQRR